MRTQIWGCAWDWLVKDQEIPGNYIDIPNCHIGISSSQVVTNLEPLESIRVLQICLVKSDKKSKPSPIWLTFGGLVEAEMFMERLKEAIKAYKENKDYETGTTPTKVVLDPRLFVEE